MTYHQGITWPWLTDLYLSAYRTMIKAEKDKTEKSKLEKAYKKYVDKMKDLYIKAFYEEDGVCNLSEVYDSIEPYNPNGCYAQAWSLAMLIRLMTE